MARRRVLSSAPLQLVGSRPLVASGNETYELELQIRQLHQERQIIWQVCAEASCSGGFLLNCWCLEIPSDVPRRS
jgi:hypothetical protein